MPTTARPDTLAAALSAFQASLPAVHKGAIGQVPGKRSYKYADLSDLSATVLPLLAAQGLSWMTMPTYDDAGRFVLQYELLHTSGESRRGAYPLPSGTAWEIGSALTYGRRYCLAAVTGVAADEDDDGAATEQSQRRPQQASTADQARAALKAKCQEKGWDLNRVVALYEGDLVNEPDTARVLAFTKSLFDRSEDELKAAS
jgi:ERF superfamily protein